MDNELSKLERVSLRSVWAGEASHFTPWLANDDNLFVLSETLGMNLEIEAVEQFVGPFRADILCKEVSSGHHVLIENQLEKTDHLHLGQLLTYASGLDAVYIIWIAAKFTDEHRSTLDWLNKITDEEFRFFGLEVELWKIGNSLPAPKFNVVSQPNDWSKAVIKAANAIEDSALSETRQLQRDFWDKFHDALEVQVGPISGKRTPQPQNWMNYPIGRTSFTLGATIHLWDNWVRAELYISGQHAKDYFDQLALDRDEIEEELEFNLDWDRLPEANDTRISVYMQDTDPSKQSNWPLQHEWLASHLNKMHKAFFQRVRLLEPTLN